MDFCLFLDIHICLGWDRSRRDCFMVFCCGLQAILGNNTDLTNSHPALCLCRGPRALPPLCLPLKCPAQWKTGTDLLLKVRMVTWMSHLSVSGQRRCTCKHHACVNHVHDLWCILPSLCVVRPVLITLCSHMFSLLWCLSSSLWLH